MNKKRVVSGITATGKLTIGNYIGAIKNFIKLQDEYDMYIFVADMHALTIDIKPEELRENKKQIMALYIACGLDPQKVTLFYQSDVKFHGFFGWIMENMTTIGELSRMTQFKDKSGSQKETNGTEKIKTGLLTYPALMAGDILLYNPHLVPVGEDQKQHLELARNIATRFNNRYGKTFEIPEILTPKVGGRIMSLTEPTKKMSKSSTDTKSYIALLDDPEVAVKKIMKAVTDSENKVYISDQKPGIKNLLTIYSSLKNIDIVDAENEFKDAENYGVLKQTVASVVKDFLIDIQQKYTMALNIIDKIAEEGMEKATIASAKNVFEVEKKIGLK